MNRDHQKLLHKIENLVDKKSYCKNCGIEREDANDPALNCPCCSFCEWNTEKVEAKENADFEFDETAVNDKVNFLAKFYQRKSSLKKTGCREDDFWIDGGFEKIDPFQEPHFLYAFIPGLIALTKNYFHDLRSNPEYESQREKYKAAAIILFLCVIPASIIMYISDVRKKAEAEKTREARIVKFVIFHMLGSDAPIVIKHKNEIRSLRKVEYLFVENVIEKTNDTDEIAKEMGLENWQVQADLDTPSSTFYVISKLHEGNFEIKTEPTFIKSVYSKKTPNLVLLPESQIRFLEGQIKKGSTQFRNILSK